MFGDVAVKRDSVARTDTLFAVAVTVLFVLICSFAMSHHEMWRDEMQAWLVARDSAGVGELLRRIKYEGHPALWYLLLFGVTRITHHPEAMQALHLVIAAGCVFVFARSAPFPRWVRGLFCIGYFPLYEYGVIARNYSLGVLFLFAAAALFHRRREQPWVLGGMLALAAHTSMHALLVAAALAVGILGEPVVSPESRTRFSTAAKTFCVAFASIALSVVRLVPPVDSGFAETWTLHWDRIHAEQVLGRFAQALLPIPGGRFLWGDLWLETGSHHVSPLVAALLLAYVVSYLARRRVGLLVFAAGSMVLFAFFYAKLGGSIRHHGFLFVNLVLALWFAQVIANEREGDAGERSSGALRHTVFGWVAAGVLGTQVVAAAIAVGQDVTLVFSAGRATAALLVERGLDRLPLVGDLDIPMSSVLGYLDQRTMYYPRGSRFGSFVVLDLGRRGLKISDENVFNAAHELARTNRSAVGVVLNRRASQAAAEGVEEVGCLSADVARPESYCVYRVAPPTYWRHR